MGDVGFEEKGFPFFHRGFLSIDDLKAPAGDNVDDLLFTEVKMFWFTPVGVIGHFTDNKAVGPETLRFHQPVGLAPVEKLFGAGLAGVSASRAAAQGAVGVE